MSSLTRNLKIVLLLSVVLLLEFWIANFSHAATISKPMMNLGLVGYWSFDVGVGGNSARDMSGKGNHGALTNMDPQTDWVDGKIGKALDFDGSNDYVNLGNPPALNPLYITISVWIKHAGGDASTDQITAKDYYADPNIQRVWQFRKNTADNLNFIVFKTDTDLDSVTGSTDIADGQWHHVVGTWDGATINAYVDGKVDATPVAYAGSLQQGQTNNALIGANQTGSGGALANFFDGLIDDARIYNRALSAGEIQRLYLLTRPKIKAPSNLGLVGYWSFNEGTSTTATDFSGNGNHGKLTNMAAQNPTASSGWAKGKFGQALNFDGVNDEVIVPDIDSMDSANQLTISAWMRRRILNAHVTVGKTEGAPRRANINAYNDGNIYLNLEDGVTNNTYGYFASNDTNWHYLVLLFDGTQSGNSNRLKGYLDGQQVTLTFVGTIPPATGSNSDVVRFGRNPTFSNFSDGLIDEVRIYNRALSAAEVKGLYQSSKYAAVNVTRTDTLKDGLVGHWSFDGKYTLGDKAIDTSGNNNDGILTNGPTRVAGRIGQALSFDGSNDYVGTASAPSLGTTYTVSAWVNTNTISANLVFAGYRSTSAANPVVFQLDHNSATTRFIVRDDAAVIATAQKTNSLTLNTWYHVVGVRDGNNVSVYVNGVAGTGATATFGAITANSLNIGATVTGGAARDYFTNGLIDDVRIYNRALTPDEIRRLYNMGR